MPNWLSFTSNPIWRAKSFITHTGEARAATRWDFDSQGYASPSNDRQLGPGEEEEMKQYNSQQSLMNDASRKATEAVIQRILPLSDACVKDLTEFKWLAIKEDVSWLYDHPAGSDFYTNSKNNFMSDVDAEGDWRLSRLTRYLKEAGLEFDLEEINEKVSGGISTPIVIDLDGDGIETTSFLSGKTVLFDINGDGEMDETAWISGRDAFLAIDLNKNGVIDGVNELFGGRDRGAGFAKLAELDSNRDGKIDKDDERYSELLLWQDENMDGITDENELQKAEAAGLESIQLDYISQNVCEHENLLGEVSSAIYRGHKVDAVDISFRFQSISLHALDSKTEERMDLLNSTLESLSGTPSPSPDDSPIDFIKWNNASITAFDSATTNFSALEFPENHLPSVDHFPTNCVLIGVHETSWAIL